MAKKIKHIQPIRAKYFIGYPPKKTNNTTIIKISAAVDKFAGKIRPTTINTGNQSLTNVAFKE